MNDTNKIYSITSNILPKSNKTFDDLISKDFDEVFVPTLIDGIHFGVFNQKRRFFVEMKKLNIINLIFPKRK